MKGLSTFEKGGVHPPDNKFLSETDSIKNAAIPSVLKVPLSQHIGSPAECLVAKGDEVKEGMLIGKSTSFISANIHSPVPGTVSSIDTIYLPNGISSQAVIIEVQGEFDRLGKKQSRQEWSKTSPSELLEIIKNMGIVGMGGATFPTHVKFTIPREKKARYFVVNGVECEPYLTADHRLMLEKSDYIFQGIEIIHKILGPEQIYIAIEENKPDAIELMEKKASESELPVSVVPLKMKYPQGDEKQVLKAVIGREVPSGGLPIDIESVVSNVGTLFAIYEAVALGKPLVERTVTVSGGAVKQPGNYKVRIGTPIYNLIEECGGFSKTPEKVVVGGPMMGFSVSDLDVPVVKGTSGILALSSEEVKGRKRTACLQCGRCIEVCPMGLNPTTLFKMVDHLEYGDALETGLMDCKECGCCGFVCPAHIPLVQGMKLGKLMSKKLKVKA
jgi:Na+-translocating ferredoxin:NAD+ oxidoreductase subunit C